MDHVPYVRYYTDYPTHRKTFALCDILGDIGEVYPPRLWAWCASNAPDGEFSSDLEMERAARWTGDRGVLAKALRASGFVDGLKLHDWDDKTGAGVREILRKRGAKPTQNCDETATEPRHKSKSKSESNKSEKEGELETERPPAAGAETPYVVQVIGSIFKSPSPRSQRAKIADLERQGLPMKELAEYLKADGAKMDFYAACEEFRRANSPLKTKASAIAAPSEWTPEKGGRREF